MVGKYEVYVGGAVLYRFAPSVWPSVTDPPMGLSRSSNSRSSDDAPSLASENNIAYPGERGRSTRGVVVGGACKDWSLRVGVAIAFLPKSIQGRSILKPLNNQTHRTLELRHFRDGLRKKLCARGCIPFDCCG